MGINHEPWQDIPDEVDAVSSATIELTIEVLANIDPETEEIEILNDDWAVDIYEDEYDVCILESDDLYDEVIDTLYNDINFSETTLGDHTITVKVEIDYELYNIRFYPEYEVDTSNVEVDKTVSVDLLTIS